MLLDPKWKFTQNWIAYEVGLACQRGMDIWVLCNEVNINFPVPYLNNYCVGPIEPHAEGFTASVLLAYKVGRRFRWDHRKRGLMCPYEDCKSTFNLHMSIPKKGRIICPTCLRDITFEEEWSPPQW
jgi:hypothetical protein